MAAPECKCVRRVLRMFDASGSEREEVSVITGSWYLETLPDKRSYDHMTSCPLSSYVPPMLTMEALKRQQTSHVGNGTYNGAFAFTLTKSPKDTLTTADMIKAAQKLCNQKSCPVIKYAWYLEYGSDNPDHPHIHGMYLTATGGRIEKKHFKRAWPIWGEGDPKLRMGAGFRGGYHRPVKDEESYSQYIAKDGGIGESSGLGSRSDPSPPDQN